MSKIYLSIVFVFSLLNSTGQFSSGIEIVSESASYFPQRVFTEDMDMDGDIDILAVSYQFEMFNSCIEYFENIGNGDFAPVSISCYGIGQHLDNIITSSIVLVDVNLDGFKDLFFESYDGIEWVDLTIEYYDELQLLSLPTDVFVGNYNSMPITILDFDGDGDDDLLGTYHDVLNETYTRCWILNDGNWNFDGFLLVNGEVESLTDDVDMDGDLDQTGVSGNLTLMENVGNMDFIQHNSPSPFIFYASGDFDGDLDLDFLGLSNGMVGWFEQISPFEVTNWHPISIPGIGFPNCTIGDIDNDGDVDINISYGQVGNFENALFLNDGDGLFTEASIDLLADWWQLSGSATDMDMDGINEVISFKMPFDEIENSGPDLVIHEGITNSFAGNETILSQIIFKISELATNDVDADGDLDLLAVIQENAWYADSLTFKVIKILNDGAMNFFVPEIVGEYQTLIWSNPFFSQLDNVGKPELIFTSVIQSQTNNQIHISIQQYNDFGSNYEEVQSFDLMQEFVIYGESEIYFADLNNDGFLEIVVPFRPSGNLLSGGSILLNNGAGFFTSINIDLPIEMEIVNFLDTDGDGDLDLIGKTLSNYVLVENSGDLNFTGVTILGPLSLKPVGCVDFDSDGDVDFFCQIAQTHRHMWLVHEAGNTFLSGSLLQNTLEFTNETLLASSDFNQDGVEEFLFGLPGGVYGLLDTPEPSEQIIQLNQVIFDYGDYVTVDLDQDGFEDLLVNRDSGSDSETHVGWLRNTHGDGCNDPLACNYSASDLVANACCYGNCGCTDINACNFNPSAICDDGSCQISGCTQSAACNYDPIANCDDGSCIIGSAISISVTANHFNNQSEIGLLRFFEDTDVQNITHELSMVDGLTMSCDLSCISYGCYGFGFYVNNYFPNDASISVVISDSDGIELVNMEYLLADITFFFNPDEDFQVLGPMIGPVFPVGSFCLCGENALTGCTDPLAVNFSELAQCNNSSCLYGISGKVFNDLNADGIMQSDEYGLPFEEVTILPGSYTLITDNNGDFFMPLEFGTYSVTHTHNPLFQFDTTPATNYVIVDGASSQSPQLFGISTSVPTNTICIDIYPYSYSCNAFVNFNMCFRNMGNVPIDGVLRLEKDPLYSAYQEITPIDSIVGNYFYFSYQNLMPGEMFFYDIKLFTPSADLMGSILTNTVLVNGYYNDVQVAMGAREREIEHACSYDPNDKQPYPIGYTESHFIENDTEVEYVIRFQNTGNAPALNVIVRDTLDTNVDLSTFRLVANTHNVMTSLDSTTREVVFYMLDILLPDSVHDEPGSHGLISYRISPLLSLVAGNQFENTAYIYFDNNDPVITNTTDHTIFDCNAYLAEFGTSESGTCYAQELTSTPNVLWTEDFTWALDGVYFTNTEIAQIDVPGDHELTLTISNPLCGLRAISQNISIEEPIFAEIIYSDSTLCMPETILLESSFESGNHWFLDGSEVATTTDFVANSPGMYELIVEQNGCELPAVNVQVVEGELPLISDISQTQNTLSVENLPGLNYQWYLDNEIINGATSPQLEITQSGLYTLIVSGEFNCDYTESVQATYDMIEFTGDPDFFIFPNPASNFLNINMRDASSVAEIHIINSEGQLILNQRITKREIKIDVNAWPAGLYYVSLYHDGRNVYDDKIIIE